METLFVHEGKIKVSAYYGGKKPDKVDYYDNIQEAILLSQGAEHYEIELMNVNIAKALLKEVLNWSDRIGSDETTKLKWAINLLNKINIE